MASANALALGDARLRLARPICGIFGHFSGFEFFLLPSIIHARPSAGNANRWLADQKSHHWSSQCH
jgi:hypothetical protein